MQKPCVPVVGLRADQTLFGVERVVGQPAPGVAVAPGEDVLRAVKDEELVKRVACALRGADDEIIRAVKVYVFGMDGRLFFHGQEIDGLPVAGDVAVDVVLVRPADDFSMCGCGQQTEQDEQKKHAAHWGTFFLAVRGAQPSPPAFSSMTSTSPVAAST